MISESQLLPIKKAPWAALVRSGLTPSDLMNGGVAA
jgi:hypothetical protein